MILVRVQTDEGVEGLGEIGLQNNMGAAAITALHHLAELLVGADVFASEAIWQRLTRAGFWPADRIYMAAISAIDIALWDVKGKLLGLPLHRLLGGPVRERVPCYRHIQAGTLEALLENGRNARAAGWRYLRWDTWFPWGGADGGNVIDHPRVVESVVASFDALRSELGPEAELCFDVHARFDVADAVVLCRALERFRPFFIEDPLRSEDPTHYRALARQTAVPIAAGEHWVGRWPYRVPLAEGLITYARPDLCIAGGITETMKIAHLCEAAAVKLVPHNPLGPVSSAAAAHLAAAVENFAVLEMCFVPGTYLQDVFPRQLEMAGGDAVLGDAPGLGVELDEAALAGNPWEPGGWYPELRRPDGAFTNW